MDMDAFAQVDPELDSAEDFAEELGMVTAGLICPDCENWKTPGQPCDYCAPDQW